MSLPDRNTHTILMIFCSGQKVDLCDDPFIQKVVPTLLVANGRLSMLRPVLFPKSVLPLA